MFMKRHWPAVIILIIVTVVIAGECISGYRKREADDKAMADVRANEPVDTAWRGWSYFYIPRQAEDSDLIWYGYELIAHTADYLGPKGSVMQITNGMNCQNCHLEGGTVPYGNNYGKVFSTYPKYRARNHGVQTIYDRINDCLERSLNGRQLDSNLHEMKAIYAYMEWLGSDVPKGASPGGTGLERLPYLDRAADPEAGRKVYVSQCQSCHGANGEGQINGQTNAYVYPPLWGPHSYNDGAGLFRISNFAAFVKNNMPFGISYQHATLSDADAWDVAAFVNSRERPHKDQSADWEEVADKPIDFPFGPYTDSFSEMQHKYGPFEPIRAAREQASK